MSKSVEEKKPIKYQTFMNQKRLTKNDYYEYKKENKKFTDELYPANEHSIYSQNSKGEFNDKVNGQKLKNELDEDLELNKNKLTIGWERISDREHFRQIYNEKISHEQIEQGSLGNCYLISLIASISHFPKLIIGEKDKDSPHLLYNIEYGDIGYYEIMFFIDGSFKIVIIDDYIPFFKENGNTVFSKSSENFFWVNLVEKAYSKICGGYTSMNIDNNNNTYDHFQVFTGFKYEKYTLYDEDKNRLIINRNEIEKIFNLIEENLKNNSHKYNTLITTGTPDENKGIYLEESFIPYKHSFSILDCKKIKINKDQNEMKLLLINNPWGRNVYNGGIGKYCLENLNDDLMNLKPYIESNLKSEDGTFWIDYDSFVKNYVSINLCKIPCGYHCTDYFLSTKKCFEVPLLYKLNIDKKTNMRFNVNLARSKSIIEHRDKIKAPTYLIINQIDDQGKIINTFSRSIGSDDMQVDYDLEKGNYIIWLYIPKKYMSDTSELKANFMVSSEHKIKIKFLNYDKDFAYIKNTCEYLFNANNEGKLGKTADNNFIKCLVDNNSLKGFIILYFKNKTKDKKLEASPHTQCEGFKSLTDGVDFSKLNLILNPNQEIYLIGISTSVKSIMSVSGIDLKYKDGIPENTEQNDYNFIDYIKEKDKSESKLKVVRLKTNPYKFIETNFNKNKEKRDEENVFNFFVSLMTQKMKPKGITKEKIEVISQDLWDQMKDEEKDLIRKKYEDKKKELKNNVLKTQVLRYIKRNSITAKSQNDIDNEIKNMRAKARLSKEIGLVKFEDDLDLLEAKIKNILPKIEYLKETENDEIKLDQFISKQNSIASELKKLVKEKITRENAEEIDNKKCKLAIEYQLFSEKMNKFLKKHQEKINLYNEINEEGKQISKEINEKIKSYNERKLDFRKEVNKLVTKFNILVAESKKLKLLEINKKCSNDVLKKQKGIFKDIDTIQNGLKSLIDNINENKNNKLKMQNDILSQDVIDNFNQRYNELNDELTRLKEIDRDYDKIVGIVNEENDMKNEFESFLNSIDEKKIKSSLEHFKSIQSKHNKLAEKINNFQNDFLPKISKYNEFIRQNEILKKEIFDIYEKFKENQLQVNETLDKLMSKIREMFDETNKLKFMPIINKSKNEMKVIWEKIEEIYANIINKLKSFAEKKGISMVRSDQPNIKNVQNRNINKEQIKQISDKINKDMIPLEEKQKEIIKIFDKLKADKSNCINNLYNLANEEEQILNEIKSVYNNDIKNINKENIQNNFEKYKNFNEKYKEIFEKIKDASNKCAILVKSYNEFISTEYDNRKKIFDNINNFARNGIGLDEKNEKIIKKSEEILNGIKNYKINELNDIFNNNVNKKMKDLNRVQEILVALMSK